jgi:NitT/TauT family transport system ATP-binding protein
VGEESGMEPLAGAHGARLQARDVTIHYWLERSNSAFLAVDGVDLDVHEGEFLSIVGPSGCGKSTFLNAVDGLLPISRGSLTLNGRAIEESGPDRAMVFQQPNLLPWRTVMGNVVYGLELQGAPISEARQHARHLIELVGLAGFADAYPSELSGGMQQRANLARALAIDPQMLLLDEPFAALDAQTREFLQLELLRIWSETRKTAIFITHDIKEAVYLADRVVVFSAAPGRVRRIYDIDLPRPRSLGLKREQRFLAYEDAIWGCIEQEVTAANQFGLAARDEHGNRT